jgi:hypothetical protein
VHSAGIVFYILLLLQKFTQQAHTNCKAMSTPTSTNVGANASDVGLIVQGTLIFLSAVVAIFGFLVKGRLERKQRERENELQYSQHVRRLRVERIREQMKTFLGPASMLTMELWSSFWGVVPSTLNDLADGRIVAYHRDIDFTFPRFMTAQINDMQSWVGPDVEQEMSAHPNTTLAKTYRILMRRLVTTCAVPLAELLKQHAGHLSQFSSIDEFKVKYPVSKGDGWGRNSYYLMFMRWTHEFEDIVREWDREEYAHMFPYLSSFPCQITPYLLGQVTELRELETKFGSASHKTQTWEDELEELKEHDGGTQISSTYTAAVKREKSGDL